MGFMRRGALDGASLLAEAVGWVYLHSFLESHKCPIGHRVKLCKLERQEPEDLLEKPWLFHQENQL